MCIILVAGGIGGILFWGGFNWAMEMTNTEAFCIGCHEMRDNPYKELQQTIHFKNRSGVRAICSDCHVPHEWFAKIRRKIQASNELFHKAMGTVDTPEKFEAHRLDDGDTRVGFDEGARLARVPQLPFEERDGPAQAEGGLAGHVPGGDEEPDLHRLPQGHRAQAPEDPDEDEA